MKKRLVSSILGLLICWQQARGEDVKLQARFEKSLQDAKSISNIEIEWLDTFSLMDPAALKVMNLKKFSRTVRYSFVAAGQKYRASIKLISGTNTNLTDLTESAFDGKLFATYTSEHNSMSKSSVDAPGDPSESADNPLIEPFMFLTQNSDACMKCLLRSTQLVYPQSTNRVIMPMGLTSENMIEMTIPGLPLGKQPTTWKIDINKEGDAFTPSSITHVVPGSGYEVVNRLLNYTNIGTYQFPTRIEWIMTSYPQTMPGTLLATGMVAVISAQIPSQVSDSMFRLDDEEQSASVVWDWDHKKLTKMAPALAKAQIDHSNARMVLLLVLLTTLIIPIVMVLANKYYSKS